MAPRSAKKSSKSDLNALREEDDPDAIIEQLKNQLQSKTAAVHALSLKVERLEDATKSDIKDVVKRRHHPVVAESNIIGDKSRQRVKMGTRGSIATSNILMSIAEPEKSAVQLIAEKFVQVFQEPERYVGYLNSAEFAKDLVMVCRDVGDLLEQQPRCLFLQSPVYVFGDIHGNLEDLHFFADNIWKMGMDLTAGKFLFLGDYVD
ncbi:hypothetical protein B484DRAFT_434325, partial [Ochromonadaceae sp. CCMP2298]